MRRSPADEALLSLLRENARASTAEIARKLGLSRTTVQNRIARLEAEGVIRGYTVRLDDEHERHRIRAHMMLTVRPKQMPGWRARCNPCRRCVCCIRSAAATT